MDPAADRRRRFLIAAVAGGLALLLLVGVGIYGLLRGPAPSSTPGPQDRPSTTAPAHPDRAPAAPEAIPQNLTPEAFARSIAAALFTWDTTSGNAPSDYAQVLADVAHVSEADAFVGDVRAYLPTNDAWAQLRSYATTQWLSIDRVCVPDAWETALAQAAPNQMPHGATAYTIEGTRHREGTWHTEPVEASRPVAFTIFLVCSSDAPGAGARTGWCEVLRLSQLDAPLR
ncbi:hypothetical protein J4H92_15025 [Leucobacter weissii]|uniref:Uncharacterized protein n=1 Tax=Leucobacter weissii TaxID=1983706 RepID=A0A939MNU3_9MICO|nr:hypothetical protein [Leucobacter weissii]MBO1903255.1 hypothetical protein [Leucobacter weissii]